jgi:hypothetical protein
MPTTSDTLWRWLPTRHLQILRKARGLRNVVIACFPKSGSTFISDRLAAIDGCERAVFVPVGERREQEIETASVKRELRAHPLSHLVAQLHVRLNANTAAICTRFDIQCVVLTRNLMDCLVSICDHWDQESCVGPCAYWTPDLISDMERSGMSRLHAVTLTVAPWYVSFYLSWMGWRAEWTAEKPPLFLTYEEFFADTRTSLRELTVQLGMQVDASQLEAALAVDRTSRFNRGVSGRGREAFQKDRYAYAALLDLLSLYPSIDFAPIFTPLSAIPLRVVA